MSSDSLLPIAPALDEPLEMLEACHQRIEQQLGTLERLLAYLPEHGADESARRAAQAVLRYFRQAGPNHHADEENDLFPVLSQRATGADGVAVTKLVDILLAEHQLMAEALAVVLSQLEPIAQGTGVHLDAVAVSRVATLYRRHIERENGELLPLAHRWLTSQDIERLSTAMTDRRQPKR